MDENDFKVIMNSEYKWILNKSSNSGKPVAWLTYSSPISQLTTHIKTPLFWSTYITSTLGNTKYISNNIRPIRFPNLLASIYGYSEKTESYSGGKPWSSLNMGGHHGFIKNSFWEYSNELR